MVTPITKLKSFKDLIPKYKFFLFDCDGVMWIEKELIEGAENIPITLQRNKKNFRFLTNNNIYSRKKLLKHFYGNKVLKDMITESHIYNSSYLTCKYIKKEYPHIKKLFVCGSEDLTMEFVNEGFQVIKGIDMEHHYKLNRTKLDRKCIPDPDIDAVVMGYDERLNYYKLTYAARVLQARDTLLFGTNIDRNRRAYHGIFPSAYSMISAIESCSEKRAEIITKPNPYTIDIILHDVNEKLARQGQETIEKKDVLMIGDNLMTDIKFANNAGIDCLLVLTGVTNRKTAEMVVNYQKQKNRDILEAEGKEPEQSITGVDSLDGDNSDFSGVTEWGDSDSGIMLKREVSDKQNLFGMESIPTSKKHKEKKKINPFEKKVNFDKYGTPTYILENLKF